MIPLDKNLDTVDFDALLAMARARLPALAKQWTDYNYHDPGIMLVELMTWLADSQIYSLARNRTDERHGFLRLMSCRARGARPATGLVFPADTPEVARTIKRGAILKPALGGAPRLEADGEITLLPVTIKRIVTLGESGVSDVTAINTLARAAFSAFGNDGKSELRIELAVGTAPPITGPVLFSLGFRLENAAPDGAAQRYGRVGAYRAAGTRLHRSRDTTLGLQRSGAMIFAMDAAELAQPILLRVEQGYALNPKLLNIAANALPVKQRASLPFSDARGNGRPGQTIEIVPSALFPADEAVEGRNWRLGDGRSALCVSSLSRGEKQAWTRGRLDEAGPNDACYAAEEASDGSRIAIRFGNGVNGRRPKLDEPITVDLTLSAGREGVVVQPTDWIMTPGGVRWHNAEPITGGADAQSPDDALGGLRSSLQERRPLSTSRRIAETVLALPKALGVGRAQVEDGWERGRRAPAHPTTRTLIVASINQGSEDQAWLNAIRRRLAPRIAVGERLLVIAPRYRRFTLDIGIVVASGTQPTSVATDVRTALAAGFDPQRYAWPFGRDLSAVAIAGWVRKIAGVARVAAVEIRPAEGGAAAPLLAIGRGELPLLVGTPVVTAERQSR
jgi:hypothetical protein